MSAIISIIAANTINRLASPASAKILAQVFNSKNIFETPITLGGKIADKGRLVEKIRAVPITDDKKMSQSIDLSLSTLTRLYDDHKKRVNVSFYLSMIASTLAVVLLLWTIQSSSRTDNSIKLIFPLVASFLSGTLFWIYKTEQGKMEAIEKDISGLEVLKMKIGLIAVLDDKEKVVSLLKDLE